jgi:hypothetical protein
MYKTIDWEHNSISLLVNNPFSVNNASEFFASNVILYTVCEYNEIQRGKIFCLYDCKIDEKLAKNLHLNIIKVLVTVIKTPENKLIEG